MNGNGLLKLYYFPVSFYSQRALFTLYEKNIPFEHVLVNIHAGEQYKPEYLHLNPYGAVPTLQDGVKVIPDSAAIMEYLEDNFSNGKFRRLQPLDKSSDEYIKMMKFTEEFLALNIGVFTYGTFLNAGPDHNIRMPKMILRNAASNKDRMLSGIEGAIERVPEAREILQKKLEKTQAFVTDIVDPVRYREALRGVEVFLQRVEDELVTHTGAKVSWWLCGPNFTLADIDLCVLLGRISVLGFEERLVSHPRPHLATYLRRARLRPTFQKTCTLPLKMRLLMLAEKVAAFVPKLVLGAGLVAVIAYGVYVASR